MALIIRSWPIATHLIVEDTDLLVIRPKDPYFAFINQCVYRDAGGDFRLIGRVTNWRYLARGDLYGNSKRRHADQVHRPISGIFELIVDQNFKVKSFEEIIAPSGLPNYEDPRIFFEVSKKLVLLTKVDFNETGRIRTNLTLLDMQEHSLKDLVLPEANSLEKNWIPIGLHQESLRLLYSAIPWVELVKNKESENFIELKIDVTRENSEVASNGGTSIVRLKDGRWIRIARVKKRLIYFGWVHLNYLMVYNSNLKLVNTVGPFVFRKLGFEVCNGIYVEEDQIWTAWSEDDETSYLARLDLINFNTRKHAYGVIRDLKNFVKLLRGETISDLANAREILV